MVLPAIVELTTPRLILRVCRAADADAVFEAEADSLEDLRPWFWWCHPSHSRERSRRWSESRIDAWQKGEEVGFLLMDRRADRLVGCMWLNEIDCQADRGSLGYWLRTGSAGGGLATEAGKAICQWAFQVGFRRIEILAAARNERSRRLAERLGAHFEALIPGRLKVGDEIQDAAQYVLLAPTTAAASPEC